MMLRDALFLARKDMRHMLRSRETWLWIFLMPILFFYFLGTVTGGMGKNVVERDKIALNAPSDSGFLVTDLAKRLEERGYEVVRPSAGKAATYKRRLDVPANFTADVLAGKNVAVTLVRNGGGTGADYDEVRVKRAVYTVVADLVAAARDGQPATAESVAAIAAMPHTIGIKVTAAGTHRDAPSGFQQAIPGTMVMFTLMVLFTAGAVTLTSERNQGLLRRLAASPMERGAVVFGKWLARLGLGLVQIGFAMLIAPLLFDMSWGPNLWAVIVVVVAYASMVTGLGMLLGNAARTEAQTIGIGVLASNVLAAIGGCWWPIEITPEWAQKLSLFLPTGWAMDAMHKLVSFGASPATVIPHVSCMVMGALVVGYVVSKSFRFQ